MRRRTSYPDFARLVRATRAFIATPGPRLAPSTVKKKQNQSVMKSLTKPAPAIPLELRAKTNLLSHTTTSILRSNNLLRELDGLYTVSEN